MARPVKKTLMSVQRHKTRASMEVHAWTRSARSSVSVCLALWAMSAIHSTCAVKQPTRRTAPTMGRASQR